MAQDPQTLYDTAQRLVGEGKLAAAEVLLRQAVDLAPDPNLYLAGLGTLLGLQAGRTEESLEILKEQLEHFPDDPTLLVAFGMTAGATGDAEEAEKAFRKAVAKNPNHPAALNSLAQVVLAKGDVEGAEKMACKAFALAPDHADYALMAHGILEAQGKVDLAYEVAAVGAQYNPNDMELVQKAVEGALERDDAERAWEVLKESNGDVSWVVGWRATLLDLQGERTKADHMLAVGRRHHALNPNFLLLEASIYQRRGDTPRALAIINELLVVEPDSRGALKLKAELGAPPEEAIQALEKVRAAVPDDPEAKLGLITAYYAGKRYEDAYAACATVLQSEDAPDVAFLYAALSLAALGHEEDSMGYLEMLPDHLLPVALQELEKFGAGTEAEAVLREAIQESLPPAPEPEPEEAAPEPEEQQPETPDSRFIPTGGPDFSGFFAKDIEDPIYEDDDEDDDDDYDDEDYEYVDDDDEDEDDDEE